MAGEQTVDPRPGEPTAADPGAPGRAELRHLDPAVVLRPGRGDPFGLLVLWFLRRSFLPLMVLGFALVTVLGRLAEPVLELTDPASVARALLTPWVGVASAVVVRVVADVGALSLAFPLTRWARPDDDRVGGSPGRVRAWRDRWQRTAAYRALRWTWPVRRLAAERVGRTGRWLLVMDRAWGVAVVVAFLLWMVALATTGVPAG